MIYQDYTIVDHNADQDQDSDPGHKREGGPREEKEPPDTNNGKNNGYPYGTRKDQGFEKGSHHKIYQSQSKKSVDHHGLGRFLFKIKASPKVPADSGWEIIFP